MNPDIVGHEQVRNRLQKLYAKQALPHALLFSGTSGIGKKRVAIELYQSLFCKQHQYGGCGECKACLLQKTGSLPHFTVVNCMDKDAASVENFRSTLYNLHLSVAKGSSKVLILDNAEHISERSQNILLKELEEPRRDTYFCIVTSSLTRIIKTIQSRAQTWHFDSLLPEQITEALKRNNLLQSNENVDSELVARFADGSLENITQLLEGSEIWTLMQQFIQDLTEKNMPAVLDAIQVIKSNKEQSFQYLSALRILARERMLQAKDLQAKFAWSIFLSNCLLATTLISERNLSIELVLENLALSLLNPSKTLPFTSIGNDATVFANCTV